MVAGAVAKGFASVGVVAAVVVAVPNPDKPPKLKVGLLVVARPVVAGAPPKVNFGLASAGLIVAAAVVNPNPNPPRPDDAPVKLLVLADTPKVGTVLPG